MGVLTAKSQITVPRAVRDRLGICPGDEVEFEVRDGEAVLKKKVPEAALEHWRGYLVGRLNGDRTGDVMAELHGEGDETAGKNSPSPPPGCPSFQPWSIA